MLIVYFVYLLVSFDAITQDDDGYAIALERIADGQSNNAQLLDLSNLNLTQIPPETWQLTQINWLHLNDNNLQSIPSEISQLTNLTVLNLSNNQLTAIPHEIVQLQIIQTIRLHDNQLTTLPPEIGQLTSLRVLDLGNNHLQSLPIEIGQLTLAELHLDRNPNLDWTLTLTVIPAVGYLDLSGNGLTALPSEIGHQNLVMGLDLSDNHLSTLPREIVNLRGLRSIILDQNNFEYLPRILGHFTYLEIYADDNPLIFPSQEILNGDAIILLHVLRGSPPYPPYRINWVVINVMIYWLGSLFGLPLLWLWFQKWKSCKQI